MSFVYAVVLTVTVIAIAFLFYSICVFLVMVEF